MGSRSYPHKKLLCENGHWYKNEQPKKKKISYNDDMKILSTQNRIMKL